MRRIALLLLLAAMPALSQIRSDQALAPLVVGAAPARQETARVASDGTNFFAVWLTRTASNAVIGGGRLSPAGELLDRPSIFIASGTALGQPDVFFVGGNFLVVYASGTSLLARRVSPEGRLVDQQAVVIKSTSGWGQIATNGDNVLMITSANSIRMLAADGTPLGADRVLPNVEFHSNPSVTSNGRQYLVAEADRYASRGSITILNSRGDLEISSAFSIPDPFDISGLTVTSNGSAFLMMLVSSGRIAFMPVDSAANTGPLRMTDYQTDGTIVATWSGNEYTLAWMTPTTSNYPNTQILAARVDAAGLPLDTAPVAITPSRSGYPFAIASNGRDSIIISRETDYTAWRTTAAIFKSLPQIDAEPAARRRIPIASSAPEQAGGSIASNGTLSLVTWRESMGFQTAARAAFIAADGQLGAPIDLGDADPESATATASNGRDFLVAYFDSHWALVARRVTPEGVLDSTSIVINRYGMPTDALAAGWSGQTYVVVTAGNNAVTVSSVTPDGTVALSPQAIYAKAPADSPAVSCAANGCSVTWHWATPACYVLCSYTENDVFARTDATGNLIAQAFLTNSDFVTPALAIPASDGRTIFVYSFVYFNGKAMFAGRITAGGVVLDTPAGNRVMTSETSFALQPVAVVYGGLYFVEPDTYTSGRLYWTRIEPEPKPHVTSLIKLHQSVSLPLTMTASSRNAYLLYSSGEDDPQLMASRLFLRTIDSPDPQPGSPRRRSAR